MTIMTDLNQYLKNCNGHWHYHRRVPFAYEEIDQRGTIRLSLKTTSLEVARVRRDAMTEADDLYWSSLFSRGGISTHKSHAYYRAAKKHAMSRGFICTPVEDLAETARVSEILDRLAFADLKQNPELNKKDAEAVLGDIKPVAISVSKAFEIYCEQIAISDLLGKSVAQKHNWRKIKKRAVSNFISICGDLSMDGEEHMSNGYIYEGLAHLGFRFSMKADGPSLASSDFNNSCII